MFGLAMVLGVAMVSGILLSAHAGHRRPPSPRGMVFRAEAREVESPFDRFGVRAIGGASPAIAIFTPGMRDLPARFEIRSYPEGECSTEIVGPDAERAWKELSASQGVGEIAPFDFDGDGAADRLTVGEGDGVVSVRSGRDGRLLFEDEDDLEYEGKDRAITLGDVDGDGCSDLALLHPRMDRSRYDLELCDRFLGAKSWVTIVSGARATR